MRKTFFVSFCVLIPLFMLASGAKGNQTDGKVENTGQVVAYLTAEVEKSHLTFIRNGQTHSCEEAAQHAREKYEYFKSRIKSAEDFIKLCASKSLISGKPYLVITPQGTVEVGSWLTKILAEYRSSQGHRGSSR